MKTETLKKQFIIDTPKSLLERMMKRTLIRLIENGVRVIEFKSGKTEVEFTKPYTHNKEQLKKEAMEVYYWLKKLEG